MKRVGGVFLLWLFSTNVAFAQITAKELATWQQTSITYKYVEDHYVNDQVCVQSVDHFMGCVEALESLATAQSAAEYQTVLSSQHKVAREDIVKTLGDFVIAKDRHLLELRAKQKAEKVMPVAAVKLDKEYRRQRDAIWESLLVSPRRMQWPFLQVWRELTLKLDPKLEPAVAGYAINAWLRNVEDPHSYLLPQAGFDEQRTSNGDLRVGAGIHMKGIRDGVAIRRIIAGGPADLAGLKARDVILAINGVSVAGMSADQATLPLKRPELARLLVRRGTQLLNISFTPKTLNFSVVQTNELNTVAGQRIGYISVAAFMGNNTYEEFRESLKRFQNDQEITGVVVDLRDNGGGSVEIVTRMLDLLLRANKMVLTTRDPQTNKTISGVLTADDEVIFNKSLVVLVNGRSASASEIFAGVVQDYKLGYVVGVRSFGKGTIQQVFDIRNRLKNTFFASTTGRFHLPSGRTNQLVGISPDFEVQPSPNPTEEETFFEREEDLYRRVIPAADTKRTVFYERLSSTRQCVTLMPRNQRSYIEGDDLQVLAALDVIACDQSLLDLALHH